MANFLAEICVSGNQIIVDEGSLLLTIGDFCSVIDGGGNNICVTIVDDSVSLANYTAQTQYADCTVCADREGLNVFIQDCEKAIKYTIPFSGVNTPVSLNDTYFYTLDDGRGNLIELCAFVIDLTPQPIRYYVTNKTSYLNCLGCSISANTTTFEVQECFPPYNLYYVLLPVTTTIGGYISFNPNGTLDQLCGTIASEAIGITPTAIFLSEFRDCESCVDQVNDKRELISCIDNSRQVVYSSVLYNVGQSSYLTINDPNEGFSGCYRIGDETTSAVTVTGYLGYSPSPSCEDCIACNGFEFEYFVCGEPTLSASTFSRQYIEIGHSFYHPVSGCCEVSQIITANTSTDTFYSFYEYNTCEECTGSTIGYESWLATDCRDSSVIVITTPSGFSIGDYLTINRGTLTTSCVVLDSVFTNETGIPFAKTTEITYSDCTNCNNNTYVAYPFAKCGESVATYYNLTLTNYNTILDNIDLGKYVFTNSSFDCYYLLNGCATPQFSFFTPNNYFTSCEQCGQPLSAGTPTVTCIICCPCSSSTTVTSVYSPFPTWTNQYKKPVLMLDAVLLGGNGLNA